MLPAGSGKLDGLTVIAGRMYAVTGAATTTAMVNGAVANTTSFPNAVAVTTDGAGNIVVALSGTTPAIRVIAESNGTYYDTSMTAGRVYTITGGEAATGTTLPGDATGFKLPGAARIPTLPNFGLTSLTSGAPGDLLLTDGTTATAASLYEVTTWPDRSDIGRAVDLFDHTRLWLHRGRDQGHHPRPQSGQHHLGRIRDSAGYHTCPHQHSCYRHGPSAPSRNGHGVGDHPGGAQEKANGPTYVTPPPKLTSLTPTTGTTAGGTVVTIHGSNLVPRRRSSLGPPWPPQSSPPTQRSRPPPRRTIWEARWRST